MYHSIEDGSTCTYVCNALNGVKVSICVLELKQLLMCRQGKTQILFVSPFLDPLSRLNESKPDQNLLTCTSDSILNLLLSTIRQFTHIQDWPPHSTLLELGATSFDVTRVAVVVETKMGGRGLLPRLAEVLLSRNFVGVCEYVRCEIGDEVPGEGGGCESVRERETEPEEERVCVPPLKRARLLQQAASITSLRRGLMFKNGE